MKLPFHRRQLITSIHQYAYFAILLPINLFRPHGIVEIQPYAVIMFVACYAKILSSSSSLQRTFTVRGLCTDAVMDTQYKYKFAEYIQGSFMYGLNNARNYIEPKGWIISRNKTDNKWRKSHYHCTDLTLTILDTDVLPVGRHKWKVENEGKTSTQILQLGGCEEGEFTCDDGKCATTY